MVSTLSGILRAGYSHIAKPSATLFGMFSSCPHWQDAVNLSGQSDDSLREHISKDAGAAFLYMPASDKATGFSKVTLKQDRVLFDQFIIDQNCRGQGHGKVFYKLMEMWAKGNNISRCSIIVPQNPTALAFAQSMGFQPGSNNTWSKYI